KRTYCEGCSLALVDPEQAIDRVRTPSFSDWLTVLLTAYKIARQFEFNSVRHRGALSAIRCNSQLTAFYRRLIAVGKPKTCAYRRHAQTADHPQRDAQISYAVETPRPQIPLESSPRCPEVRRRDSSTIRQCLWTRWATRTFS